MEQIQITPGDNINDVLLKAANMAAAGRACEFSFNGSRMEIAANTSLSMIVRGWIEVYAPMMAGNKRIVLAPHEKFSFEKLPNDGASDSNGGSAFPQHGWTKDQETLKRMGEHRGMTLLDYFAAKALPELINALPRLPMKVVERLNDEAIAKMDDALARRAYDIAESMMKERARRAKKGQTHAIGDE